MKKETNFNISIKEKTDLNQIYVWLSMIEEINYMLYIRLLKFFQSVDILYILSKEKSKFKLFLIQNNIILSKNLINKLTNFNLKEKSVKIYNNLIKQKIDIIHIEDLRFPKSKFINMYNKPLCLFLYGKVNKLNEKVIYLYKEKFNEYGEQIYEMFNEYISQKKWNIINNVENFEDNNIFFKNLCWNKVYVINQNIFDENYNLKSCFKKSSNNLYILIPNKTCEITNSNLYITELIVSISNVCIIPQAKYDENMYVKNIVELFLEQGKNVLVVPGNIYCKFSYLSNYLIKEGAEIILNKHDIDKYL